MMQGLIIGIVGTTVGGVGRLRGRRTCCDRYQLIRVPVDVYQVSYLPFTVLPLDFALVVVAAVLDLLRRDDLSVAPGRAPRSGAGAAGTNDEPRRHEDTKPAFDVLSSASWPRGFVARMSLMSFLEARGIVKSYPVGGRR